MALMSDFSGTYNPEVEEAQSAANSIVDDTLSGYYRTDQEAQAAAIKELAHWSKVYRNEAELFAEFEAAFRAQLLARGFSMDAGTR